MQESQREDIAMVCMVNMRHYQHMSTLLTMEIWVPLIPPDSSLLIFSSPSYYYPQWPFSICRTCLAYTVFFITNQQCKINQLQSPNSHNNLSSISHQQHNNSISFMVYNSSAQKYPPNWSKPFTWNSLRLPMTQGSSSKWLIMRKSKPTRYDAVETYQQAGIFSLSIMF